MTKTMNLHNEILEPGQTVIVIKRRLFESNGDEYAGYAQLVKCYTANKWSEVWFVKWSNAPNVPKQIGFLIPLIIEPIKT